MRAAVLPADAAYRAAVADLWASGAVRSMAAFPQHGDVDCLRHCLAVAYLSWCCCRRLGLNARAAARGGLLHDERLHRVGGGLHQRRRRRSVQQRVHRAKRGVLAQLALALRAQRAGHERHLARSFQMAGDVGPGKRQPAARKLHAGIRTPRLGSANPASAGHREHGPHARRAKRPLARVGQLVEPRAQPAVHPLPGVARVAKRLRAVKRQPGEPRRLRPTVRPGRGRRRHAHRLPVARRAAMLARAMSGRFIVYTCRPSTPCAAKSVSWAHAYSMPARRRSSGASS